MATTVYVDLVMDNGELVRIECPKRFEDILQDTLENTMKRRDWWSPSQFDGCTASYLGHLIERVNMGRVVGGM